VGSDFACGIENAGTLSCWGDDSFGQMNSPEGRFTTLTTGLYHACAGREDGEILCWGRNSYGEASPP
jgi:alpha-tubulin suppressor-like RCC1 family protein